VIRTGLERWVPHVDDEVLQLVAADPTHLGHLRTLGATSVIIMPLRAGAKVTGALGLVTTGTRRFGPDDVVLARELAARASQAIANATLYRERAHVARTLQATLLPTSVPRIPGLEVAGRFVAGGDGVDVGGDFYDVFPGGDLSGGTWNVVIGDVRGKGVEAAALTGVARTTIRSAAINEGSPAMVLRHLNEVLLRSRPHEELSEDPDPRFCSVVLGTLHRLESGFAVDLAVAGHPLPFLLRADGSTEQVGLVGTLLGIVADPRISDVRVHLEAGDALVLYTDGVTERHAGDRFFEEEGLASVLGRCAGFTAATLAERVETAARAFGEDDLRDDLAIVVVRVPERAASTTSATTDLPAHPLSARRARRFVLTALDAFSVSGLDEVAELLTSEVVTNAVVHAHSGVRVSVEGVDGGVRVSVHDSDPLIPALRRPIDDAEHGRGLYLVDVLATRWGVEPGEAGKSVWFELGSGAQPRP
jgi:serine phosphatase RsbU (regulator of sigma subunit)/anti-sigma regulatory factor (Ser/Thr protein kinase)